MIYGAIKRIYDLTTHRKDILPSIKQYYKALKKCGHEPKQLRPHFLKACRLRETVQHSTVTDQSEKKAFLHLAYNPNDPPRSAIQQTFQNTILEPPGEPHFSTLWNREGTPIRTNRLVIAYKRHWNIRNYVFPRRLYQAPGQEVSKYTKK